MEHGLDIVELLARIPFFSDLDMRRRKKLARLCIHKTYPVGTHIIEEGSTGLGMFVITSGLVEVYKTEQGSKIFLNNLSGGDMLGEMSLIDNRPRSASGLAVEPTKCLLLTRDTFRRLVKKDTEIAWCLVPILVDRLRNLNDRLVKQPDVLQESAPTEAAAGGDTVPAEAELVESELPDVAEDNELEREEGNGSLAVVSMFWRLPFAAVLTGTAVLGDLAETCEASMEAFASGAGLSSDVEFQAMMSGLPTGIVNGSREALDRGLKIPGNACRHLRNQFDGPNGLKTEEAD